MTARRRFERSRTRDACSAAVHPKNVGCYGRYICLCLYGSGCRRLYHRIPVYVVCLSRRETGFPRPALTGYIHLYCAVPFMASRRMLPCGRNARAMCKSEYAVSLIHHTRPLNRRETHTFCDLREPRFRPGPVSDRATGWASHAHSDRQHAQDTSRGRSVVRCAERGLRGAQTGREQPIRARPAGCGPALVQPLACGPCGAAQARGCNCTRRSG